MIAIAIAIATTIIITLYNTTNYLYSKLINTTYVPLSIILLNLYVVMLWSFFVLPSALPLRVFRCFVR